MMMMMMMLSTTYIQYLRPSLRLTFAEGVKLLQEAGYDASPEEDLDTEKVGMYTSQCMCV